MKAQLAALSLALAIGAAPAARPTAAHIQMEKPVLTMHVDSRVVIAKDGSIAEYTPTTELPASIATTFHSMVRGLTFEPVLVGGKPVNAATRLRATLAAEQLENGNYRVQVDNITFPPDRDAQVEADAPRSQRVRMSVASKTPVRYPRSLLGYGVDANVLAYVRMDTSGNIVDVQAVQSALLNTASDEKDMARVLAVFEAATLQTLRRWKVKVDVPPGVTPTPEDLSAGVVFTYRMEDSRADRAGRWVHEARTVRREPSWLLPSKDRATVGVSDVADGDLVPVDSPFRLKTPVKGVVL